MPLKTRASPALLVGCIVLVACGIAGCGRRDHHPIVVTAIEEVTANPRVAEVLGATIARTTPVTGSVSETDGVAALQFEVKGSKGGGVVVVEGKKVAGTWGVTSLELRRPGFEEHLVLTSDLEDRTGTDTPRFDPNATEKPAHPTPPPPADIEIALPPGPPNQ